MTARPGPLNSICDVAGLSVGHATDDRTQSGVTVILPDDRCTAAVDVRGGGPGTRETDALAPGALVDRIDALVLSGGSAFGLAAADGAMSWLAQRGRGFDTGAAIVPIVPAAILYDLANGGDKSWDGEPPYRALGIAACEAAAKAAGEAAGEAGSGRAAPQGRIGAGRGARAGADPGGVGSVSLVDPETGFTVGALAAVNSFGSTRMADGCPYAWPFEIDGEFGSRRPSGAAEPPAPNFPKRAMARTNTTLAVAATDAPLDRPAAQRLAVMAQDGLARAIRPVHTPFDGDSVFALATGRAPQPLAGASGGAVNPLTIARLGAIAADCIARAVARAVYEAAR